ncbi:ABC transporter [Streptomyces sp. 4N509B]|uniref:ABC transporter n=1 Tax=Streptomyces sp. 4N509B TaxID=3457413 RepID=UPI003FCF7901
MIPLLRYEASLLLRSRRWLPPLLLHAILLAVGVRGGQPVLDSLGWSAAALLPAAVWLARACAAAEPPAARACVAAAGGPARAHVSRLLTALCASAALGTVTTLVVVGVSAPHGSGGEVAVPRLDATAAGLLAALACALLGTAVGALCSWPVVRGAGRAIPAAVLAAVTVLVADVSPANAAVSELVNGSRTGTVDLWLLPLPLLASAAAAAAAYALAGALSSRRH